MIFLLIKERENVFTFYFYRLSMHNSLFLCKRVLCMITLSLFLLVHLLAFLALRAFFWLRSQPKTIAFFHPYCNAGGGGERVLWRAINAMQKRFSKEELRYVIFTGDSHVTPAEILSKVRSRFNISLSDCNLEFIFLRRRWLLEAQYYPRFTLLLQMLGQYFLGFEALFALNPEIFVDTTGCPLTMPLFKWIAGSKVVAYVHYPTITKEMIDLVERQTADFNNAGLIASSWWLTKCKVLYYRDFAWLYWFCGQSADIVMTNGSWTNNHVMSLWRCLPTVVFPPCDVQELSRLEDLSEELLSNRKDVRILSVGQIRPEKNHLLQLRILAEVRKWLSDEKSPLKVKLLIAGGCRDEDDFKRVEFLKNYARESLKLNNEEDIEWHLNVPYEELLQLFQSSLIGLHTMWNEHFGISVVEGLAAGTIMVAHNSGGPKFDIIGEPLSDDVCGYLATTKEEYAQQIISILQTDSHQRSLVRQNAKERAKRFSNGEFDVAFCAAMEPIFRTNFG